MSSRRAHLVVLAICAIVMVAHQAVRWGWFIDDAGICFAYARNLANGEGVVAWPGGERVEGISDPLWIGVLAIFQLVGLDGFLVAKPLGMAFGVGTLWLVWRTARLALPGHEGPGALVAPIALSVNAQFAIWSASGLENGLWCLVLAGSIHRTILESRTPGAPWSALLWLLLALTRPEGLLYAAVGGAVFLAHRRDPRSAGLWLAVFAVPFGLVELGRILYFAWPLPNTFYAKIASRGTAPLDWDSRGWNQLREWSDRMWYGWLSPLYLLGLTGSDPRRIRIAAGVVGVVCLSLLWPGPVELRALWFWPVLPEPPQGFVLLRVCTFLLCGAVLPFLAVGAPRLLCGLCVTTGLAFSVVADGDWMGAFRWMSLVAPPLAVLFAVGVTTLADTVQQRFSAEPRWGDAGWLVAVVATGLLLPPNLSQIRDHVFWNFRETTRSVKLRVDHTRAVLRRTFHDGPVTNLDVDQGAHLWWAPDYREVDMAMLVDIPMARHWYQQRAFVREYVFEENEPTFAHVGGWWAKHTGFRLYPEWEPTFFELPPYENEWPPGPFRNVFARRELVMAEASEVRSAPVAFMADLVMYAPSLPAPWVAGADGYLEVPFSLAGPREPGPDARVWAFLARDGRVVASFELLMGYGLYPMNDWKPGQVFRGRHAVPVPHGLAPGSYDLGVVVTSAQGEVIPALEPSFPALMAVGEVLVPGRVRIVADLEPEIDAVRGTLSTKATAGDCESAEAAWVRLLRHRPRDEGWEITERPPAARALAECWANRASRDPATAVDALARAHRWDHRSPALARIGRDIGDRLFAEGRAARDRQDWDTAYARFSAVLTFQPWRAWARRWAEEARDHRLGLTDDVRIGIGGDDDLRNLGTTP